MTAIVSTSREALRDGSPNPLSASTSATKAATRSAAAASPRHTLPRMAITPGIATSGVASRSHRRYGRSNMAHPPSTGASQQQRGFHQDRKERERDQNHG